MSSAPADRAREALPQGHRLDVYEIGPVLGQGGFGITYLAEDRNLAAMVAVKEYLPVQVARRQADLNIASLSSEHDGAYRWGLDRFLDEARTLARFNHPAIVRVLRLFEANGTAYMVMSFEDGETLNRHCRRLGRGVSETELLGLFLPLMEGLAHVHAGGFLHRDIKPSNIIVRPDGSPVLIDFGSARQAIGDRTQALTSIISPGYAPLEQYTSNSRQGPWTDIYALGACMFWALTGNPPVAASERNLNQLDGVADPQERLLVSRLNTVSPTVLHAIQHALALAPSARPASVEALRAELLGGAPSPAGTAAAGPPSERSSPLRTPPVLPPPAFAQAPDDAPAAEAITRVSRPGAGAATGTGPRSTRAAPTEPGDHRGAAPARRRPAWLLPTAAVLALALTGGMGFALRGLLPPPTAPAGHAEAPSPPATPGAVPVSAPAAPQRTGFAPALPTAPQPALLQPAAAPPPDRGAPWPPPGAPPRGQRPEPPPWAQAAMPIDAYLDIQPATPAQRGCQQGLVVLLERQNAERYPGNLAPAESARILPACEGAVAERPGETAPAFLLGLALLFSGRPGDAVAPLEAAAARGHAGAAWAIERARHHAERGLTQFPPPPDRQGAAAGGYADPAGARPPPPRR